MVVNLSAEESEYLTNYLKNEYLHSKVTHSQSESVLKSKIYNHLSDKFIPKQRNLHYIQGGIIFTNSKILFSDFISSFLTKEFIRNLIVFKSESLFDLRKLLPLILISQNNFNNIFRFTWKKFELQVGENVLNRSQQISTKSCSL